MNKIKYKIHRLHLALKYGFLWSKPRYLLKASKNVLLHRLNLKKDFTLRTLCLAITYACNYNCPHCLTREMMENRKGEEYLQIADYQRIAKEAMAMGAISFAFQGGEIWLRPDFKEIIKAFEPQKHYITVTTNGFFINQKTVQELIDLGVNKILFSLESATPEDHDKIINKPGGYQMTMNALKIAIKSKMKIGINLVLSKENIYSDGVKRLMEFCNQHRLLLVIIFARALGNWKEYRNLMLSDEDIAYYNNYLVSFCPYANRDLVYNYNGTYGCPAAKENFYINPWGDVLACPFNHTFFGNLKKESLQAIQDRALKIRWFNHFHPRCLTAEEKVFMDDYFPEINKNSNGMVDYSYWLEKQKNLADK